ncbi:inhibin beta A chain [Drosophila grimshawi]|uniref:GH13255 n=1 Tax=Drosophila grimshawi TaxID=7222 RepID=B4JQ68_DROGR|nr:inhibin beta A chain [Drosophila grimshawi]EDV99048.1 GH13255 [Drosophila grimshawi]
MAKYYMTLMLLLCLALQNNNIYARSHPSAADEAGGSVPLMRAHPHPRHQPHQHVQHLQQHHTRQQRDRQPKHIAPDPSSSEEEELQQQQQLYDQRMRRHLRSKQERLLQQEHNYHRVTPEQLKTSPKLWQLLSQGYQFDEWLDGPAGNDQVDDSMLQEDEAEQYVKNELQQSRNATTKTASSGCPKCESHRQEEHISEEELRNLRIEFVKQQILEKLRLKESPKVSGVELPRPIFEGIALQQHPDESSKNKDYDDYYARTNQKFILLQREERECRRLGGHPSMCFSFKIDDADADGFDVSSAVLWLYKNKQNYTKASNANELSSEQRKQTIVVSEVEQQLDSGYLPLTKTIAIQSVNVQDEWMKINIEWPIKRWFGNRDLSHLIQISCESCDIGSMEEIISINNNYRPFIMIDTQNRRSKSRQKRNINCSSGVTECCREKLYISFADIGWDNWIMQPKGYDAYFCRGSCSSVASVAQAASHHSSLLKILSTNGSRKPLDLVPCCTAKQYSSLQLVVLDSNNSATVKTLPNMVVESCGCR